MPYRPKRWMPGMGRTSKSTIGYSGGFGGPSGATDLAPSDLPTNSQVNANQPVTEGLNPSYAKSFGEDYNRPQAPRTQLLAPTSIGGSGRGTFSIGNPANGTINLGGILGPRANPDYDPNVDNGQLPYKTPGFFRRMLGDTGSDLNASYVNQTNNARIASSQADSDWNRWANFQRELAADKEANEWNREQARLSMDAARYNTQNSTALKEAEIRANTELQRERNNNERRIAEDENKRRYEESMKYGDDPIRANELKRQEIDQRIALGRIKPTGVGFSEFDPWTGGVNNYVREGGTPAGYTFDSVNGPQMMPAVPSKIIKFDPNDPTDGRPAPPTPQSKPTEGTGLKVSPEVLDALRKAASPSAQLTPPQGQLPSVDTTNKGITQPRKLFQFPPNAATEMQGAFQLILPFLKKLTGGTQ